MFSFGKLLGIGLLIASACLRIASALPSVSPCAVRGKVQDSSRAALRYAHVIVTTESGELVADAFTGDAGSYCVRFRPQPGVRYRETISTPGFRSVVFEELSLQPFVGRTVNVQLAVEAAAQSVTVNVGESLANGELATQAQFGMLGTLDTFAAPFSVASYTGQTVRNQQAQTVSDVLLNEPGVQDAQGRYSENSWLELRGFPLYAGSALLDGLPYLVDYRSPNLDNIERVELLRGPGTLLNGVGYDANPAAGGTIDLIAKRAGNVPLLRFDGGYSSRSDWEGHLDAGRRFLAGGRLGLRGQLGGRYGDTPVDHQRDVMDAATLEADFRTPAFRASLDASDQYRGMLAERGALQILPGFPVPAAPPLSSNIFDRSTTFQKHETIVLVQAAYNPGRHVELDGAFGHGFSLETYEGPYLPTLVDAAGDVTLNDIPDFTRDPTLVARAAMRLDGAALGVSHQFTLTADYVHDRQTIAYDILSAFTTNIYRPIALAPLTSGLAPPKPSAPTNGTDLDSIAATDVMTALHGRLRLLAGLREQRTDTSMYGSYTGTRSTVAFAPCTSLCVDDRSALSPSGAAMFRIAGRLSVYANYMQDLQQGPAAPVGAVNQNQLFSPVKSSQQEAGAKLELAHASATLALFRITEPFGVLNPSTDLFGVTGRQRNRGAEAQFFGNVTGRLVLLGGVTLLNAVQEATGNPSTEGKRAQGVPSVQLTEGAEWTVPETHSLVLTARISASSGQYADTAETQRIPAWGRLDLGGRYVLALRYRPTLRINFDNIDGHRYWESGMDGLSYGLPRQLRTSLGFRF